MDGYDDADGCGAGGRGDGSSGGGGDGSGGGGGDVQAGWVCQVKRHITSHRLSTYHQTSVRRLTSCVALIVRW